MDVQSHSFHDEFVVNIVFRVDASRIIGTGHVVRCLTLAESLRARGASCLFVSRDHPGNMLSHIRANGFEVRSLSVSSGAAVAPVMRQPFPAHSSWLGVDWETDADQTLDAIGGMAVDWLVVDHYAIDVRWERRLGLASKKLMVIDDLADRSHECDLLLDQNWFGEQTSDRYRGLVPASCRCMLGPSYALLRPEYAELRARMSPRDGMVRRVLVFMGGSDSRNQTGDVLDALMRRGLDQLAVDVVIGVNHPDPQGIARKVAARPASSLFSGLPSLAGLMVRADLMIGGGGSTTWERMCLGLPAVVISIADNQTPTNLAMMKAGYIDFLGQGDKVSVDMIAAAVRAKLTDPDNMRLMSRLSRELVQGTGVPMLTEYLLGN